MLNLRPVKFKSNYYPRSDYYDKIFSGYYDAEKYQSLLRQNVKQVGIDQEVKLHHQLGFGSTQSRIKKEFGKPKYTYINQWLPDDLQIWLYKQRLGGFKVKTELHFFKRQLFYFNHTFSYLTFDDKKVVNNILKKKYFNNNSTDIDHCEAVDPYGRKIFVTDSLSFQIHYVTNDHALVNNILTTMRNKNNKARQNMLKQKELFHKL